MKTGEKLLTVPQVAEALHVDPETIYRWCNANPPILTHVRIPGRGRGQAGEIRIRPETLEEFVNKRTLKGVAA